MTENDEFKRRFDPTRTALVVVDVQNDFVDEAGLMAQDGLDVSACATMLAPLNEAIDAARRAGAKVVYLRSLRRLDRSPANVREQWPDWERVRVKDGSWGAELHSGLRAPLAGEPLITKRDYDGFQNTDLDTYLRSVGVDSLVFGGCNTNVCVEATARHGYAMGYRIAILSDATASNTAAEHEGALRTLGTYYGPVLSVAELTAAWR